MAPWRFPVGDSRLQGVGTGGTGCGPGLGGFSGGRGDPPPGCGFGLGFLARIVDSPPPCRERHTLTEHASYLARERWILLRLAQKTPREPHPSCKLCRAIPDHTQRLMAWSPNLYNRAADCQSHLLVVILQSLQPSLMGTVSGP